MTSTRVTATAYLQLKADRNWYGNKQVTGARIMKVTQNKPATVDKDVTVVKTRITVPVEAFEQIPVVDIELPLSTLSSVQGEVVPA